MLRTIERVGGFALMIISAVMVTAYLYIRFGG